MRLVLVFFAVLLFSSCSLFKTNYEFSSYSDPVSQLSISYPKGWYLEIDTGKTFRAYKSEKKKPNKRILVSVFKIEYSNYIDKQIEVLENLFGEKVNSDKIIVGNEYEAKRYYFGDDPTKSKAILLAVTKDSVYMNSILLQGSSLLSQENLDIVLNSIQPGYYIRASFDYSYIDELAPPPSKEFKIYNGPDYLIEIPINFKIENTYKDKSAIYSHHFMGARRGDSYIRIDAYEASPKTKLNEFVDLNHNLFPAASKQEKTELSGTEAITFNYMPGNQIYGRVYFFKVGNRIYRVTLNWFGPEEPLYKEILLKSLNTIKIVN